jgi:ABC-type lipoprotein export system ATPase subunit
MFLLSESLSHLLRQDLQTCILVTHRPESARFCSRTYEIRHRQVTEVTHEA